MGAGLLLRAWQVVRGLAALVLLVALVVGVPWALWHFVGWPLPHRVPSVVQVGRALDHQGIPDQALVDALAVVVWLTWAVLVTSVAVEIPAALSGRHTRRLPLAGAFHPVTGCLVAAVVVACLTLAPRPGHAALPGPRGAGTGNRPVAALVLRSTEAVLTDATEPAGTAPPTSATPAAPAPSAVAPGGTLRTYVVQPGDTLWGIAERQLGDPLQWQAVYALNAGRSEPGGATLSDPHWIDPGWTLLLPASATPTPAAVPPPAPAPAAPGAPVSPTAPTTASPPTTTPLPPPTTTPGTPVPTGSHGGTSGATARRDVTGSEPVRLPSGSVVGGSFAAGVLSAVALGRLRRRHAYRYHPPEPGRDLRPDPLRPTLRHLASSARADAGPGETVEPVTAPSVPAMADDDAEHRERPDLVEVGTQEGRPVELALSELGGVTLAGPGAPQVAAAWVTAVMVRAGPRAAEVVMTGAARDELFGPGGGPAAVPGLRVHDGPDRVLAVLERMVLARSGQLAEAEVSDVVAYRQANPWEPVPMVLAAVEGVPGDDAGRWAATAAAGPRLGFAVLTCDPRAPMPVRLAVGADRVVTAGEPDEAAGRLLGVRLFGLLPSEAVDVVATLAEAEERPEGTDGEAGDGAREPEAGARAVAVALDDGADDAPSTDVPTAQPGPEPWPEPPTPTERAPVSITVFGPYEIAVDGAVVSKGLRSVAKELAAWLCLRPEGASVEAAVEALWPGTERGQVHRQFWLAAANLRTRLGTASDPETKALVQSGDVYRLDPATVACDLWAFEEALGAAARAETDRAARAALRWAADRFRGELLAGTDYPWVEPVRQDIHRRALDAHLRLADLDARLGAPEAAEAALRRATDIDRYAEEPYRRLMTLQADQGRQDAVAGTWALLGDRLAEIDVDCEPATLRLYRSLTGPGDTTADRARRARLLS